MQVLKPLDYYEPATMQEACQLLSKYGDQARVLAGGVDLVPRMRRGVIKAGYVINIAKIQGLADITFDGAKGMRFGAMATLHALETSRDIQKNYPVLYEAVHQITSYQAKCMGTAVGNLCVATPASDVATALLALDAELTIDGTGGQRTEPVEKFFVDYQRTSLKNDELVTGIVLPAPQAGTGTAFINLVRTHADIAKVTVAVSLAVKNGVCSNTRIALGSVASTVIRAKKAEAVLEDKKASQQLINQAAEVAAGETSAISDVRSTAEYRKDVTRILVVRALNKALEGKTA